MKYLRAASKIRMHCPFACEDNRLIRPGNYTTICIECYAMAVFARPVGEKERVVVIRAGGEKEIHELT